MKDSRNMRVWICFAFMVMALWYWGGELTEQIQRFFSDPEVAAFVLYLETGQVFHAAPLETTSPPPETTLPMETVAPTQPREDPLVLPETAGNTVNIRNSCGIRVDGEALLRAPLHWNLADGEDRVLLFHTHATESYTKQPGQIYEEDSSYRTFNPSYNMLSIGEELVRVLAAGGITAVHDRTLHDYPSYSGSYDHARKTIRAYLNAYPSIELVIDLHRDAMDFEKDPQLTTMATVNGQKSAQLMLVAGTDHNVPYSGWQENLSLGVKLTAVLEKMHPGITRPIQLRAQRFNLDMTPGSLLVEVGANGNTHQEALTAVRVLGAAILAISQGVNLQNAPPA